MNGIVANDNHQRKDIDKIGLRNFTSSEIAKNCIFGNFFNSIFCLFSKDDSSKNIDFENVEELETVAQELAEQEEKYHGELLRTKQELNDDGVLTTWEAYLNDDIANVVKADTLDGELVRPVSVQEIKLYNEEKYQPNGQLDTEILQGALGDCALIAGAFSLSCTSQGAQIIKDAISLNYNESDEVESYNVNFVGLNKSYEITKEEIQEAQNLKIDSAMRDVNYSYSSGDKDVLLLELAWSKYCFETENLNSFSSESFDKKTELPTGLTGVDQKDFIYALTGLELDSVKCSEEQNEYIEELNNEQKEKIKTYLNSNDTFKLSDIVDYFKEPFADDYVYKRYSSDGSFVGIHRNQTYEIIRNVSENDNIARIQNKETGEIVWDEITIKELNSYCTGGYFEKAKNEENNMLYENAMQYDVSFYGTENLVMVKDVNGNDVQLQSNHAFAVKKMDENEIILINPHDTSQEIKISKEEFCAKTTGFFRGVNFGE